MQSKQKIIFDYLSDEGYRPSYDDDGDILFKHEGNGYVVLFKDQDPDYTSLSEFFSIDFPDNQLFDVLKIINKVNAEYILGKIFLLEKDDKFLRLQVDSFGSAEDFKNNFSRYLNILTQMEKDFGVEYSELPD